MKLSELLHRIRKYSKIHPSQNQEKTNILLGEKRHLHNANCVYCKDITVEMDILCQMTKK